MKPEKENYFQVSPARMHNSEIYIYIYIYIVVCGSKEKALDEFKLVGRHEKFSVAAATSEATKENRGNRWWQDRSEDPSNTDRHLDSSPTNKGRKSLADSLMCTVVWCFCKTAESFVKSV